MVEEENIPHFSLYESIRLPPLIKLIKQMEQEAKNCLADSSVRLIK